MANLALNLVEEYITAVYGKEQIHDTQRIHVTQAFIAGLHQMGFEYEACIATADNKQAMRIAAIHQGIKEYSDSLHKK